MKTRSAAYGSKRPLLVRTVYENSQPSAKEKASAVDLITQLFNSNTLQIVVFVITLFAFTQTIRGEINDLRVEMNTNIGELREEMNTNIRELREEMNTNLRDIRTDMNRNYTNLKSEIDILRMEIRALNNRVDTILAP